MRIQTCKQTACTDNCVINTCKTRSVCHHLYPKEQVHAAGIFKQKWWMMTQRSLSRAFNISHILIMIAPYCQIQKWCTYSLKLHDHYFWSTTCKLIYINLTHLCIILITLMYSFNFLILKLNVIDSSVKNWQLHCFQSISYKKCNKTQHTFLRHHFSTFLKSIFLCSLLISVHNTEILNLFSIII